MSMRRSVPANEPPRSPEVDAVVRAMLNDEPPDPAAVARVRTPELIAARAQVEERLRAEDWPNLGRYQEDNERWLQSGGRPATVFIGDSITEAWPIADPELFSPNRVCRGIAGQTSPQVLLRFYADVIDLKPATVHLLCGINDVAGNTGPTTPYRYLCNVRAMISLAQSEGVRVLLGTITPAARFQWKPDGDFDPRPWIAELNGQLKAISLERKETFIDYHSVLCDSSGAIRAEFSHDHLHPNRRGYAAMRSVLESHL